MLFKKKSKNKQISLKKRIVYWFDNCMAKGSMTLIHFLITASVILAAMIAGIIIIAGFNEDGKVAPVIWDSISTLINAWVPEYSEDSFGYLILMSIVAIAGVFFTSVLIGIITSSIEEKISSLKKGNSVVVEENHIVVLGFYPGESTLLQQLILAADGKPTCVVIAENKEREDLELSVAENINVPKNFRIICRTVDITDPASLEKCSIETCKSIIISPTDDMRTAKAVLAVSVLLHQKGVSGIPINAIISRDENRFPPSSAAANNIATLPTNRIIARMIAHSCTQTGLSATFREIFNFEGCEFYLIQLPATNGITFRALMGQLANATPVGVFRNDLSILNPDPDLVLQETDKIIVFCENRSSAKLMDNRLQSELPQQTDIVTNDEEISTLIFGYNETLPLLLSELSANVSQVHIVAQEIPEQKKHILENIANKRNLDLFYHPAYLRSQQVLLEFAQLTNHIIILNDHEKDAEEADMDVIFLLMNLRDIRERYNLNFNITVEMQKEHNHNLIDDKDRTDFLVSSSMSSLILAQLAENPELNDIFQELLSNRGNEIYLKSPSSFNLEGTHSVVALRQALLNQRHIFLGVLDAAKISHYNLPIDGSITLTNEDFLIVLGNN
ncbi:MAG: hypothetical protein IKU07_10645 [Oscillospiraceae bacterium]|nr:hypothetical protein [Oscillospiraceae bacterium]